MRRWMPLLPSSWRTDVTVITSSGRDRDGKRLPGSETAVKGVFVAPAASEEEGARSEATTDTARLYLAPEHGSIPSTAQIRIPKPHTLSGRT